jgi:ankyrin repeat protein
VAAALKRVPMLAALPHGRTGEVPLFAAVAAKNLPLVKLLVEAGADAGARDARGRTPADVAEGDGAASMARWLRQAQADAAIAAAAEGGAQMYQPM